MMMTTLSESSLSKRIRHPIYSTEDTAGERFVVNELDEEETEPIGGRMDEPKLTGMTSLPGRNPNGIKAKQLKNQVQHSLDLFLYRLARRPLL
jgi:hypothetical protein